MYIRGLTETALNTPWVVFTEYFSTEAFTVYENSTSCHLNILPLNYFKNVQFESFTIFVIGKQLRGRSRSKLSLGSFGGNVNIPLESLFN